MNVPIYGLLAEFDSPAALVRAAHEAVQHGYRKVDAFSPFPIEELNEALHLHKNKLPLLVLLGGIAGAICGYLLQYYVTTIQYPINIAGRPLNSWPMYIVIVFELAVLFAGITAVLGMLALNGLPMPYHPVFNVARFALASSNRFFLVIEATDPKFDHDETGAFLERLEAKEVCEVAH